MRYLAHTERQFCEYLVAKMGYSHMNVYSKIGKP